MSECHCTGCKLDDLIIAVAALNGKVDTIMTMEQVDSDDLAKLDSDLKAAATSLAEKINGLALPKADLQPLLDDVKTLSDLSVPTVVPPPSP